MFAIDQCNMNFKKWICCLMCLFSVSGCLKGPSGSPDLTDLYVQAIDITLSANEDFLTRSDSFYCFHSLVGNSGIHAVLLEHSTDFQQFIADKKVDTLQFRDLVVDTILIKQKFPNLIHWNNRFFDSQTQPGMNFTVPMIPFM